MIVQRPRETPKEAIILYTNDLTGRVEPFEDAKMAPPPGKVGGVAYLAALIRNIREENAGKAIFYLDGGDTFQGSVLSDRHKGLPMIAFLNKAGADAVVVGNHEFDRGWGIPVLKEMAKKMKFSWLGANLVDHATRKVLPFLRASVVAEHCGMRAAIVGITTSNRSVFTQPNIKGVDFIPPFKAIRSEIRKLDGENPHLDLHIVVAHEGPEEMRPVAEKLPVPAVIVGGHTQEARCERMGKSLYVQGGEFGKYLGVLHVFLDPKSGEILRYENKLIPVLDDAIHPDEELNGMVLGESRALEGELAKAVGQTPVDLTRNNKGESLLDDLITDAMREETGAEMAFTNSSGTRADIPKGKITMRNLYGVIPWDIPVATADLKAKDLKLALERSASSTNYGSDLPDILHFSGLSVIYDLSRSEGERVVEARLTNGEEIVRNGKLLNPRRTFRIATRDFLLEGGRNYDGFRKSARVSHGDLIRNLVADYLQRNAPLSVADGRIVFMGSSA